MRTAQLLVKATLLVIASLALGMRTVSAADIDVYFITGQSNAANFAERAAVGALNVGYSLNFARTRTNFGPTDLDQAFVSNVLDETQAVSILSTELSQGGLGQAIYGFALNGTSISNEESTNWYPGDDPAGGQSFDGSMYGDFVTWADARLTEITDAGNTPVIKGLFWFQGERDAVLGQTAVDAYQTNFENLVYRFREDFGENLPIVATDIREGVSTNAALRDDVNLAMAAVAANDPLLSVVPTADLSWVSATDVHLDDAGYAALAPRWADAMLALQGMQPPNDPSTPILFYDSVSIGDGVSQLQVIGSETNAEFVSAADSIIAFGANTSDFGQHASQGNTVSLGNGTDKFIQFGGDTELLDGPLNEAALDDGEWIGATFTAEQAMEMDSFSFSLFVNSASTTEWSARDAGLFLRIGDTGEFVQFGESYEGVNGGNGAVTFEDSFSIAQGETLEWRLAFTDRTKIAAGLPATKTTRIGSIQITAVAGGLPGDFNGDGSVDAADYAVWRNARGFEGPGHPADGNNDGFVNDLDYQLWRSGYGASGGVVQPASAPAPEPTAAALLLAATLMTSGRKRK